MEPCGTPHLVLNLFVGTGIVNLDELRGTIGEISFDPLQCKSTDTIMFKFVK